MIAETARHVRISYATGGVFVTVASRSGARCFAVTPDQAERFARDLIENSRMALEDLARLGERGEGKPDTLPGETDKGEVDPNALDTGHSGSSAPGDIDRGEKVAPESLPVDRNDGGRFQ